MDYFLLKEGNTVNLIRLCVGFLVNQVMFNFSAFGIVCRLIILSSLVLFFPALHSKKLNELLWSYIFL